MVKVYKDIETESEIGSDSYEQRAPFGNDEFGKIAFELVTSMIVDKEEDFGISINVDEDAEEGATAGGGLDASTSKVIDLVKNFRLTDFPCDKEFFRKYIAHYVKNYLLQRLPAEEKEEFTKLAPALMRKMYSEFANAVMYFPEIPSRKLYNEDGSERSIDENNLHPIYAYWHGEEEAPRMIYFKHGVNVEKY